MPYPNLKKDDILGSKEISFKHRRDLQCPQLLRLTTDFDMVVLEVQRRAFSHISKRLLPTSFAYVITNRDYPAQGVVFSPLMDTLTELEIFAKKNHVDILHDHLFGDVNNMQWRE